jgi:hypothetical protein
MTCLIRPPALQPSIHLISFQQGRVRSGTTRSKAKQSKPNQSKAILHLPTLHTMARVTLLLPALP